MGSPILAQTGGDSWTQFRGPNSSGIAAGSVSPPVEFGPEKNLLWKTSLPAGQSSPAIWRDRIFITAFDAEARRLEVIGLQRATGQILWRQPISTQEFERVHQLSSPATATPAVDGDRVYAYFGSYGVVAYDLDGNQVWAAPMPLPHVPFGSGTSPIVAGELLILNRHEPKAPFLIALDRKTGRTVWKREHEVERVPGPGFASYSTPVIVQGQIIVHGPTKLEAFDLTTGKPTWWVAVGSSASSTPVVDGNMVYVATWSPFGESDQMTPLPDFKTLLLSDKDGSKTINREEVPANLAVFSRPDTPNVPGAAMYVRGSFARFDSNKDNELQENEWEAGRATVGKMLSAHGLLAVKPGGTGDVTSTHVLWKETKTIPEVPSPLAYQNRVYLVRSGGIVTCLEATTGKLVYRERLGPGTGGAYFSSPVAVNGRVIVASGDGMVSVLAAGDRLDVLARNNLGEAILASPAVVDGVLYVRTASGLSAFAQK